MAKKRVLVVGGDGYCGWATALHLSTLGYEVAILDSLIRRHWDATHPDRDPDRRSHRSNAASRPGSGCTGRTIGLYIADVADYAQLAPVIESYAPDAIVHFGEQRSAPFSMIDREHALMTQTGNVTGTLNILFAMRDFVPDVHLVKLGTMGEYGTPNIDIEEGYIEIEHNGRRDVLPYPKQPGSFYHLSKVHDSDNISFACRIWGLRATDLNQGVVYGNSNETGDDPELVNRFDYDGLFGTVLNRFCVEAVVGDPLTVYGAGGQTRSFIDMRFTVACVELSGCEPARSGPAAVTNQFTSSMFGVLELAERVQRVASQRGLATTIEHRDNPRVEREAHYYNAKNTSLLALGLQPHLLDDGTIGAMLDLAQRYRDRVDMSQIAPNVQWAPGAQGRNASSLHQRVTTPLVPPDPTDPTPLRR